MSICVPCFLLGIGAVWVVRWLRRATFSAEPLFATDAINMKHADYWTRRR